MKPCDHIPYNKKKGWTVIPQEELGKVVTLKFEIPPGEKFEGFNIKTAAWEGVSVRLFNFRVE